MLELYLFPHLLQTKAAALLLALQEQPDYDNTMIPALGGTSALMVAGTCFGRWLSFPPDEEDDTPEEKERKKRQRRQLLAASVGHLGVSFVIFASGYFDTSRIFPE